MSRPQRAAAAHARTYREASDSDDPMHDDEKPLSSLSRPRPAGRATQPAELNDEIDDDEDAFSSGRPASLTERNSRLPFVSDSKEDWVVLDEEEDEEKEAGSGRAHRSLRPLRLRRASSRSPSSRQGRSDPLQDEVEGEDDDEFEHERALLPHRSSRGKSTSRSSPSPPLASERVLSSDIELRRRRPNVDYRKTKIDRQSMYTPDAWKKADKAKLQQPNGKGHSNGSGGGRGAERRKKQYEDDLFEPDEEEDEDAEQEDDEEAAEDDEDDVLEFSHLQHGSRRSERTLGKKVDYSSAALDEAIRSVQKHDWESDKRKRNNTAAERSNERRRDDTELMDDADEHRPLRQQRNVDGDDAEVQPMTDSDAEDYEGRRARRPQQQVVEERKSEEDTAFRLQAEQYVIDGLIPGKLIALRRVTDNNATSSHTQPPVTASSSCSPSSTSLEYLVKWRERAYKHSVWLDERILHFFPGTVTAQMSRLRNTLTKAGVDIDSLSVYRPEQSSQQEDGSVVELEDNQFYNPDFNEVHRIISHRRQDGKYLVKWKGLGYGFDELTWETVADIDNDAEIARYHRYSRLPTEAVPRIPHPLQQPKVRARVDELTFGNDRELREYQKEGVSWMCFNWLQGPRPSLLADEMGLGKTAQCIAVCRFMQQYYNMRGPFLVVAPLSTVGHWQREFETWTDMNAVVYHGTQEAREAIQKYEFHTFEHDGRVRAHKTLFRFNVLIIPDSMIHREKNLLCSSQTP